MALFFTDGTLPPVTYAIVMIVAFVSKDFKKARYEELALSTTAYSETGWVFQSFFVNANGAADLACSSVTSIIGYQVNHCVKMSTYSVKFQLTRGRKLLVLYLLLHPTPFKGSLYLFM